MDTSGYEGSSLGMRTAHHTANYSIDIQKHMGQRDGTQRLFIMQSNDERSTEQDIPQSRPVRYCFKVPVEQIPGPALGRSITLANDFMLPRFRRKFD